MGRAARAIGIFAALAAASGTAAPARAARLDVARLFGGAGLDEAHAIAVAPLGRLCVAGSTTSADLVASQGAAQAEFAGGSDAVIACFEAGGDLAVLTYLGGTDLDTASDLAVDAAGNVYVAGETSSADFPVTAGVLQDVRKGLTDGWVAKLDANGGLVWSTYLGGAGGLYAEGATAIAVDAGGHAYVTGRAPAGFPVTDGAFQETLGGQRDAFVAKLAPDAASLVYSTFLGGPGDEEGTGIAVDAEGHAYVGGRVLGPSGFPVTPAAFQATPGGGGADGFVARLAPDGAALDYATFLGGDANDQVFDLALGPEGRAFVVGHTSSTDFPTTPGVLQEDGPGFLDLFVAAFAADGASLVYATHLGGTSFDQACSAGDLFQLPYAGIAVDAAGRAAIAACTSSRLDFPLARPLRASTNGDDGVVALLDPTGASLLFASFVGGSSPAEGAFDVAMDAAGRLHLAGGTASADFATTSGPTVSGDRDGFVVTIATPEPAAAPLFGAAASAMAALARRQRRQPHARRTGSRPTRTAPSRPVHQSA